MEQIETTKGIGLERQRVEAVVETLATFGCEGESVAEVAHDARNMVTALGLYCDLIEEPGVLATPFAHYGNELRLVAAASRRLVEKLVALDAGRNDSALCESNYAGREAGGFIEGDASQLNGYQIDTCPSARFTPRSGLWADRNLNVRGLSLRATFGESEEEGEGLTTTALERAVSRSMERVVGEKVDSEARGAPASGQWDLMPAAPIQNMAQELLANQNLLAALAGPSIKVSVQIDAARKPVRLTGEDLTRVMVNLVKNAAEGMPAGGSIKIGLSKIAAGAGTSEAVRLTIEDSGPGIPAETRETIFSSGYTTRRNPDENKGNWPSTHRGLGLAITRSIVEAAGGRIQLSSQAPAGARFEIELPVRRIGHQS